MYNYCLLYTSYQGITGLKTGTTGQAGSCITATAERNGCLLYTSTSNMVYQMGKVPREEWDRYLAWVEDFEYQKLGIPRPDLVLYLDMPIEVSQKLLLERYHGDSGKKDIHESHLDFLRACRESARYAGQRLGWREIPCAKEGEPLPVEEIHQAVLAAVSPLL